MKQFSILCSLALCTSIIAVQVVSADEGYRGQIVSYQKISSASRSEILDLRKGLGMPALPSAPPERMDCFKLVYLTPALNGTLSEATGAVLVPSESTKLKSIVSYQHETIVDRSAVPSKCGSLAYIVASAFSSDQQVVVAADYLGLSESGGVHPYLHAATEASSTYDFLLAARRLLKTIGKNSPSEVYLTGYSQGGHATMALQRYSEAVHSEEVVVAGSAPVAGPYDLSKSTLPYHMAQPSAFSSLYFAYAFLGYAAAYDHFPRLNQSLLNPFDAKVPELFDGNHSMSAVYSSLPSDPRTMLRPNIVEAILSPDSNAIKRTIEENDVYDWKPAAPICFIHGQADRDVPFQNAVKAVDTMKRLGGECKAG